MKKLISYALCLSLFSSYAFLPVSAADNEVVIKHRNVVGSQTCYADDTDEKVITGIPEVYQGLRINQPVFIADGLASNTEYSARQTLKDGTVLDERIITADSSGRAEFSHVRNCEMLEILSGAEVIASVGTEKEYINGVMITYAPMSWQVFQRDENDMAEMLIKGETETDGIGVSVEVDGDEEAVTVSGNTFFYTRTLDTGNHTVSVKADGELVAQYDNVAVGDIWVAAGQSNMTDMGALTDGFKPDESDPVNDNMHIMFAEDTAWQRMSHPAGEGRFFKTGVRTSPVTSFAREISDTENVPVGIVQTSVGGTNIWQWVDGIRNDPSSGYLIKALKACFDKIPSRRIKGILWYQGCNDAINENYAYNYKNLQKKLFDELHSFFGEDVPIISTQINDANQDSSSSQGYYDAWSFVKDVQRRNEELYDNVYVVGTSELELGDTIHNSAASNLKVGAKWARAAKNVAYGYTDISFRQPSIESAKITGDREITLTFKNTNGLKAQTGTKRIGITNGLYTIQLGDLKKEFTVRRGGNKVMTASNSGKGTEMEIASAEIADGNKVIITTEDELAGVIAVDCMYGKRFTPTLVDAQTNESVMAFYNVIASYEGAIEVTPAQEIPADMTAALDGYHGEASDSIMYINKFSGSQGDLTGYGLMKFTLGGIDLSSIASASLAVYAEDIDKDRSGNITVSEISTSGWDSSSSYNSPAYSSLTTKEIRTINSNTAGVFPVGSYSDIDITDYMRSYTGDEIGIGLASNYASVLTLSGKNSDNPPKLVIVPGRTVELSYICGGEPCADMEVTIEAVGATEYPTTKFTTDKNGRLTLYLREGSYKAVTEEVTGERNASANTFTVSNSNISESYEIERNSDATPEPEENPTYTFGDAYNEIKPFNTSALPEAAAGNSGLRISTSTSNYNNVVIRSKTSANSGYYPYGQGLPENGYYLFVGSGGNGGVNASISLPQSVGAGKYIRITYAKPYATNNGGTNRNADNSADDTITIGIETLDLKTDCEFDTWYTSTVMASSEISNIDIALGRWGAVAVSEIAVTDSADMMELTCDATERFITSSSQTVQYTANVYKSITTLMGGNEITARGGIDESAAVEYSVNGYNGVSIDSSGVLTISPEAQAGEVTVSAVFGGIVKELALTLKPLGKADGLEIFGDEAVRSGDTSYRAIAFAEGETVPAENIKWEIAGETNGASISQDGTLTVPDDAAYGIITIKASIDDPDIADVSAQMQVTVRTEQNKPCPYKAQGLLLKDGETNISAAKGIDGLIIEKTDNDNGACIAVVKVFDSSYRLIASAQTALDDISEGVQSVDLDMDFTNAAFAKIYFIEAQGTEEYPVSGKPYEIVRAEKNGSMLERVVVVKNAGGADTDAALIVSQYKENRLMSVYQKDAALSEGVNEISIFDIPLYADAKTEIMLWKSVDGQEPLAEAFSGVTEGGERIAGAAASDEIFITDKGTYKNVPLVADWITGERSGLGMGKGILSPSGAPYGVDPELTDVSELNVSYAYDGSYEGAQKDNVLWYKTGAYLAKSGNSSNSIYDMHAADWEQKALPIGSGYMGAMLFGMPDKDQIQLNEETFWAAGYRGVQTAVSSNSVNKNMSEGINGYMSVGNLFIDTGMPKGAKVTNYYRDLDLDEAVAHVRYEYDGVKYEREYFASYPKEVVAVRYSADKENALSFKVNPVSMHPGEVTVNDGEITIIGRLKDSEPYSSGGNAAWSQESDLEYCTKIKVIADDGEVIDGYNEVKVSGATGVTILIAAATDYDKDQFELNADGSVNMEKTPYKSVMGVQAAVDKASGRMRGAAALGYDELKAEHIADYKSQFDTVRFSITGDEVCRTPTDELQKSFDRVISTKSVDGKTNVSYDANAYKALDKHLEELHFNYARYMMISSSRSTTMPANLQGKWCQSTAEIWGSCYCININMEMNYWFAGGANLLDSGKALIDWFNSQIPAGRVTARNMYKVTPKSYTFENGRMSFTDSDDERDDVFIMHTKQAIMGTTDLTGSTSIQSAGNTAWLMYNLWDLYQTSGDRELLANELYPIMRKAANFYTQYLYTNERKTTSDTTAYPDGYYYTTWEGRSPEQGPTHEGIKYDLQLVAGMYDYTIAAAEVLGIDADKAAAWKEIRNHLETPVELGADGEIKEWAEEVSYNTDADGNTLGDPVHRHISHLVGLYPGTLITRDTPELLNGAKIVLQNRGDDSTGWSCSNKFLLWARTLEGDKALELFRYQLAKKTYSNLFDTHAPFQIDGNFGSAAGVMELLMQSQTGTVYILPALPSVWDSGEISGIKAKNGAEVSIKWSSGKADEIRIVPANDGDIAIGYDKGNSLILNGSAVSFEDGIYTIRNAVKGEEYVFTSAGD